MDIEHLGYVTGMALLEQGWVKDPADLFFLTAEQLGQLPGFKEKSIQNLLAALEDARHRPLWRLLVGLNIRHVGPVHAGAAEGLARRAPGGPGHWPPHRPEPP
jgi:DNA ligase (NAD+)